ncbi:MAG: hydroxyacid dehydrogenase [Burkholderiales bacterium]|nr:hydroxyacid dehydrogenase [Opitutaceae bacterium]
MHRAIIITTPEHFQRVYPPAIRRELARRVVGAERAHTPAEVVARPELLADVEYVFTTWQGPRLDAAFLAAAPRLRAVFHAAGTVRGLVTPEFWASGIPISNAQVANGLPVADFAYGQILLALKGFWRLSRDCRRRGALSPDRLDGPGVAEATVGLVSLGGIARALVERLAAHPVRILAHDPYIDASTAAALGVELVSLEEVFERGEVVSCHAPLNDQTAGLVTGTLLSRLKRNATFLNTARGRVVDTAGLIDVMRARPDLTALLDVTDPEPLPADSPLWSLANVIVSPHIAGSTGRECALLARAMIEELDRHLADQPLRWATSADVVALTT